MDAAMAALRGVVVICVICAMLPTVRPPHFPEETVQRGPRLSTRPPQLRERKTALAKLETIDSGKPIDETEWDMDDCAGAWPACYDLACCAT